MPSKNTRKCIRCQRNRSARFFSGPRGKICSDCSKKSRSKATHEARVTDTYGLLDGEYEQLLAAQNNVCAICKQSRKYRLNVDHDHKTGLVRGLCCRLCNGRLLTAARDNPQTLLNAAEYLTNPPAIRILGERLHKTFRKDTD